MTHGAQNRRKDFRGNRTESLRGGSTIRWKPWGRTTGGAAGGRLLGLILTGLLLGTTSLNPTTRADGGGDAEAGSKDYMILLKAAEVKLRPGITEESLHAILISGLPRVHAIVQFEGPVIGAQQETLHAMDVQLLGYVPNLAFYASFAPETVHSLASLKFVRAVTHVRHWYKTESRVLSGDISEYSRLSGGRIFIGVEFYDDVGAEEATDILHDHAGDIVEPPVGGRALVEIAESELVALLEEDSVQWALDLEEPRTFMDEVRTTIGADAVQGPPLLLDGTDVVLGIWDCGVAGCHADLAGRVTPGDGGIPCTPCSGHATNITGIAIGNGSLDPSYRGVAPNGLVVSYDWWSYFQEHDYAVNPNNPHPIVAENNSWTGSPATPKQVDQIVTGYWHERRISSTWAAGNSGPAFQTLATSGQLAKNAIVVGGTNSSDDSKWRGASRGPTPDGRLKPDIAAPACNDIGDFVIVPASDSLNTEDQITMEVWMKPKASIMPGGQPRPLLHYSRTKLRVNGTSMSQWYAFEDFTFFAVDPVDASIYDGVQAFNVFDPFDPNVWYHAVATYDGSVGKLYLDGQELLGAIPVPGSTSGITPMNTVVDLFIGATAYDLNRKFNGILDEVRVYDRALTSSEVESRYDYPAKSVGDEVLIMGFDEGAGQIVHDSSGHGNDGFLGFTKEDVLGLDGNEPEWRTGPDCNWPGPPKVKVNSCLEFVRGLSDRITTTSPVDRYGGGCGTSNAAPAVAGSIALLIQHWRNLGYGSDPWPSTVKAILIQTADDIHQPGPDFGSGYGRLDIEEAAALLTKDNGRREQIIELPITWKEVHEFDFEITGGASPVKVTLAWDDPPAQSSASRYLVNDLDLLLISPDGRRFKPYVLDPDKPGADAKRKRDRLNNVEQVVVAIPFPGTSGTWTAVVRAGLLPGQSLMQDYSLVLPEPVAQGCCLPAGQACLQTDAATCAVKVGTFYPDYPCIAGQCVSPL
jgi:hypothetical protein